MKLVTWNLNGLEDNHIDERTEAAVFTTILGARLDQLHAGTKATPPPEVILFQEVTAHTFTAHLQRHLSAGDYKVIPLEAPDRQIFEVIAFREPLVLKDYKAEPFVDSQYARILHTADFENAPQVGSVRVLTGHLDSGTDAGKIRVAQFNQIAASIGPRGVFGGDANFRKADWEAARKTDAGAGVRDAWELLGELSATKFTWQRDDYKARFDRVWVGPELEPKAMGALGVGDLPGIGAPISDHIGLAVTLRAGVAAIL